MIWLLWALCANVAARIAPGTSPLSGLALLGVRGYARGVHRLRVRSREHIPQDRRPGPLIVVANHASGADPVLIQAACPFQITWIMAADMAHPVLAPVWQCAEVITLNRRARSAFPLREALRALSKGKVIGVFPEGHIVRPPGAILPFHPGVALLAQRSGAAVLPMLIERAPMSGSAWTDLFTPSRAVVRALPIRTAVPGEHREELVERWRAALVEASARGGAERGA